MKRILILSLLAVFLTTNFAYATFPIEELSDKMEVYYEQQELIQEKVEELFIELLSSKINSNDMQQISPDAFFADIIYMIMSFLVYLIETGIYVGANILYFIIYVAQLIFFLVRDFLYLTAIVIAELIYYVVYWLTLIIIF